MSWHIDHHHAGGWRCGEKRGMNSNNEWRKLVMYYKGPKYHKVSMVTKTFPEKIEWVIKKEKALMCNGNGFTSWYSALKTRCKLKAGTYTLECKDKYGEGWGGGYLKIKGKKYCA